MSIYSYWCFLFFKEFIGLLYQENKFFLKKENNSNGKVRGYE